MNPSSSSMSRSRVSSSASLGASEMVAGSLPHTSNLATKSLTVTLGSWSVDTLNLHFPSSEPTHEDDTRASSSMEAQTMTIQLTSVQVQVLMGIESVGSGGLLIGQCCAHFGRTSITRNTPTCLNLRASRPLFLPVPGFRV